MKYSPLLIVFCLLPSAFCLWVQAQDYSIDWFTIDGGGGTSTGGVYAVSGTIGQPDAGVMAGGSYTITGGFWSFIAAIQTPGAPTLHILQTNNAVRIWWSLPAPGWVLYETSTLSGNPLPWTRIDPPYQTNATQYFITGSPPVGNRFYRLQKE